MPYAIGERAKSIGKNTVEGLCLRFTSEQEYDAHKRYFSKSTTIPMRNGKADAPHFYNHTRSGIVGTKQIGWSELSMRDEGVHAVTEYDPAFEYTDHLMSKATTGGLYYSTGAAMDAYAESHKGNGIFHIDLWPIAEVSSTFTPADKGARVFVSKSADAFMSIEEADAYLRGDAMPTRSKNDAPAVFDPSVIAAQFDAKLQQAVATLMNASEASRSKDAWALKNQPWNEYGTSFRYYLESIGELIDLPADLIPRDAITARLNEVINYLSGTINEGMMRSKMGRVLSRDNINSLMRIHQETIEVLNRAGQKIDTISTQMEKATNAPAMPSAATSPLGKTVTEIPEDKGILNQVTEQLISSRITQVTADMRSKIESLESAIADKDKTITDLATQIAQAELAE